MTNPLLSICIPTFNREAELKECLESIRSSWLPNIEIVVSDNASTDATVEMLEGFSKLLPLRWQRQSKNVGFDQNCVDVIAMSRGRYCWILGSDDSIAPNALVAALDEIREHQPDIFHFGYIQGDKLLQPLSRVELPDSKFPIVMNKDSAAKYISGLQNLSLTFLFISCFIFKRENWVIQEGRLPGLIGSNYVHAFMLHSMIAAGASILSTKNCVVIARAGPNEWNAVPGKFLWMDATTLVRIYDEINRDTQYFEALGKVFRRSYTKYTIFIIAVYGGFPRINACRLELARLGYSDSMFLFLRALDRLSIFPYFLMVAKFRRSILNFWHKCMINKIRK